MGESDIVFSRWKRSINRCGRDAGIYSLLRIELPGKPRIEGLSRGLIIREFGGSSGSQQIEMVIVAFENLSPLLIRVVDIQKRFEIGRVRAR